MSNNLTQIGLYNGSPSGTPITIPHSEKMSGKYEKSNKNIQYIPAEGESVESYDEGGYKTLHFGDISSQLTPPDTPQEL